jgi:hypothetical protein
MVKYNNYLRIRTESKIYVDNVLKEYTSLFEGGDIEYIGIIPTYTQSRM